MQNIDDSTHLLQFEQNLLTAVQHSSAADLQTQGQHGQFLSNLMDLGRSYAAFFPEVAPSAETQPHNSFLPTLWHAEEAAALEQGQAELETFIQGVDDPDRLLRFESHLLQAAKLPLMSLGQDESFLAALVRLGKDYATLNPAPPADLDIAPPELFLDRLWQAQPQAAQAAIEFSSQQLTEFLSPFTLPQRSQVLEFECNLLEWVKQIPALQPQLQDAQFIQDLLGVGQLYAALRFSDPSPSEALPRPSFLDQLWQGEPLQGETLEQAQSLFEGLGVAVGNPKAVLLALRLAIAQERQPEVPADPEADPDAVPAPTPDLTLQMGQLAAAYGALNPEPADGISNFFLNTLWSTGNSAALNNLEKFNQGVQELQTFLAGDEYQHGVQVEDQAKLLGFESKILQAVRLTTGLSNAEKQDQLTLKKFVRLGRAYTTLNAAPNVNLEDDSKLFLHTGASNGWGSRELGRVGIWQTGSQSDD